MLVIFDSGRWIRTESDKIAERGDRLNSAFLRDDEEQIVALVPARDVTVRTMHLPDLASAQANAAARLSISEDSLSSIDKLHVTAGEADENGYRPVIAIESERLAKYLSELASVGLDPDYLLATPLLLPVPENGFVRATFDDETVVRGTHSAFLDDAVLTPLLAGTNSIETLDRNRIEQAIVGCLDGSFTNMRHSMFAKRKQWAVDEAHLRRLAVMALVLGVLVLAIQIVTVVRMTTTVAIIESQNKVQAAAILPPGTIVTDPATQAEARLTALQGAGGGFTPLASAFATAVNATPNVELGSMIFDGAGGLRATVRAGSAADLSAVEARLAAVGLRVVPGPIVANQGRPYRDITVTTR